MKRIFAAMLVLLMAAGLVPAMEPGAFAQGEQLVKQVNASIGAQAIQPAAVKTGDDGTTNWDFIEPVTHKKSVPSGYVGISTAAQLNAVRNNLDKNYILMANIDLSKWGIWVPIGEDDAAPFKGIFDGNGYVVKNITVNVTNSGAEAYAGLFGYCSGGAIKNLGISVGEVNGDGERSYAGGIAGYSISSIINCYNNANVFAYGYRSAAAGGIAGSANASISNCYNTGIASASASYQIDNSYTVAGGIAGVSTSSINNCHNMNSFVRATSNCAHAGGIVGNASGSSPFSISNCYNKSSVSASSASTVPATNYYANPYSTAGGIAGFSGADSISNCYNGGNISGTSSWFALTEIGGIAGRSPDCAISKCYNTGAVSISASYRAAAGGISGFAKSISNCYNTGAVSVSAPSGSDSCAGGLAGGTTTSSPSSISNCYNEGTVSGADYRGGVVGYEGYYTYSTDNSATTSIKNCYYINSVSKTVGNDGGSITGTKKLTAAQMKQQSSYTGFDFSKVWTMAGNGYPHLRGLPEPSIHTHSFSAWKATKAATCKATGTQSRTCSVCKQVETKTLAKLTTHKAGAWVTTVKATTTTAGKQEQKCTVCGKLLATKTLPANHTIKLNASKVTLGKGESFTLKATTSVKTTVKWKSDNTKAATVSSAGVVKAVAPGSATITATTAGGRTAKLAVTVKTAPTSVKLSRSSVTLGVKESYTPSVSFNPSDAASYKRSWSSSNNAIATVDAKGKITAHKAGKATITVTTFNGKKASITVNVKAAPTSVKLSSTKLTLNKGKTATLKATLAPSGAASYAKSWTSDKPKIAKVDANGKVTAVAKGTATISYKTFNGKTAKCVVTVK